jgi:hypothetical protein
MFELQKKYLKGKGGAMVVFGVKGGAAAGPRPPAVRQPSAHQPCRSGLPAVCRSGTREIKLAISNRGRSRALLWRRLALSLGSVSPPKGATPRPWVGLGRIVALYCRSSTSYRNR